MANRRNNRKSRRNKKRRINKKKLTLLFIVVILFIGYILNRFKETALFLLCYCPIRQFTGGYHADNYKKCLLSFILIYIGNVYFIEVLMNKKVDYIIN